MYNFTKVARMCEQKTHLKALHSMPETDIINVRFLLSTASSTKLKYASSKNKIGFYSVRWHSIVTFLFCLFILNFLKLIVCYWPCFLKLLNLKSILILRHIEILIRGKCYSIFNGCNLSPILTFMLTCNRLPPRKL